MQRRRFLVATAGLGVSALLYSPRVGAALEGDDTFVELPYRTHGFDLVEKNLLANAMGILQRRINCKRIWDNAATLMTGSTIYEDYFERLPIDASDKDKVMATQIGALPELDRREEIPDLHIHAFYEESNVSGQAAPGIVLTRFYKPDDYPHTLFRADGEFHVHLNTFHMSSRRLGGHPEVWAGVIAHEMMHNLGHGHPVGVYEDSNQIVAFEKAIITNGRYRPGMNVYRFGCRRYQQP